MDKRPVEPNFKTEEKDLNKTELAKRNSNGVRGKLHAQFRDLSVDDIEWESEQLAKSHGLYLEFNRAKTGQEKDWMYMIRISIPGGGPLNSEQWRMLDEISDAYTVNPEGIPALKVTTRQNIQFHWIRKKNVIDAVRKIAATGYYTLNGCGDNARNVMGCPMSRFSKLFNANTMAHETGEFFRLPFAPHIEIFTIDPEFVRQPEVSYSYGPMLLNRKFKIAFSAFSLDERSGSYIPDNCVELRTNDLGVAPVLENGKVGGFQLYVGGGQGERNGKPTFCALGEPLGIFPESRLRQALEAVVRVHEEWGDRQNRHWARVKYVVRKMGIEWYRRQVADRVGEFELPDPGHDYGGRLLHHGWMKQESDGLWAFGAFIENGRLFDGNNGDMKKMVRKIMDKYKTSLLTTPNQDIIFTGLPDEAREEFEADLNRYGYGHRNGGEFSTLRKRSVACVGLPTCRLSYTESEKFLPVVIDELEKMGYGDLKESIGLSGCERQCSRPATKTIGWIGTGKNQYQLKLMGTEDARNQGEALVDMEDEYLLYLRSVSRGDVPVVTAALFDYYRKNKEENEGLGEFHRRIGVGAVIQYLKKHPKTAALMEKTFTIKS